MRATTIFRRLLGVTQTYVAGFEFDSRGVCIDVRPSWRKARCSGCGRQQPGYDRRPEREWRHLGWADLRVRLRYAPRRVDCSRCGVCVEQVPWAEAGSRFTRDLEELVAYLAQVTDKTKVTQLTGVSWSAVGGIVERVVGRRLDGSRLDDLRRIGIDEFSYRRRHRYLTTVVDHDRRRVVWAAPGRSAATLRSFLDELGSAGRARLECATIDMCGGYITALKSRVPHVQIVFDRFHVQRLGAEALDVVRRVQQREVRGTPEGRELFRTRFALLKNAENLTPEERAKLSLVEKVNAPLYRAYLLKEALVHALSYRQPARAERALRTWLAWASRSRLPSFVKAARTIRKRFDGVLAYVRYRLTNGVVEGLNNRLRMVARRAFGFHSAESLTAMLFLCCGGVRLNPRLPRPIN